MLLVVGWPESARLGPPWLRSLWLGPARPGLTWINPTCSSAALSLFEQFPQGLQFDLCGFLRLAWMCCRQWSGLMWSCGFHVKNKSQWSRCRRHSRCDTKLKWSTARGCSSWRIWGSAPQGHPSSPGIARACRFWEFQCSVVSAVKQCSLGLSTDKTCQAATSTNGQNGVEHSAPPYG